MLLTIFYIIFGIIYLLSCAEIIGSWILTRKKQDIRWPLSFSFIPIIIPILAPVAAYDSIYYAEIMYNSKKRSEETHWQESLYQWIKHNYMSIDEWAEYNNKREV